MTLCELPRLPSELLLLRSDGWTEEACLDFDREMVRVARRLRRMAQETEPAEVKAPRPARKGFVWSQRPRYSEEQLLEAYGVESGSDEAEAVGERVAELRQEDFADADWDDGDPDGEG